MGWEALFTLIVVVGVLVALVRNIASPVYILIGAIGILMTAQALTGTDKLPNSDAAVAGFGNSGLITVGFLFVVVAGLIHTGALDRFAGPLLGHPTTVKRAQLR